jgi:hypothetical protein
MVLEPGALVVHQQGEVVAGAPVPVTDEHKMLLSRCLVTPGGGTCRPSGWRYAPSSR